MACQNCLGSGWKSETTWIGTKQGAPTSVPCNCNTAILAMDQAPDTEAERAQKLEDFWPGLNRFEPSPSSNLARRTRESLVVTATVEELRSHVARIVLDNDQMRRTTDVLTDDDLIKLQFSGPDGEALVEAATEKPYLLILQLGVRQSKNDMLAGIILTALAGRRGAALPTWLVVDPDMRIKKPLPCWSEQLVTTMQRWPQVKPALADEAPAKKADRDAAGLREAVQKAGGRLLRADAMKLLVLSDRSLSRVTAAAGLRTQQDPPGSNVVYITT